VKAETFFAVWLGFLAALICTVFILTSEGDQAYKKGYRAGYAAGVANAKPVVKHEPKCTASQAAMWWIGTSNMRQAKRELCGAKR
jgi:hypothetical protein